MGTIVDVQLEKKKNHERTSEHVYILPNFGEDVVF